MKCKICGRPLKNPRSSEVGYGPVCYKRRFGDSIRIKYHDQSLDSGTHYKIPGQMKIEEYIQIIGAI